MVSATFKCYWPYRNDVIVVLDLNIGLKIGFEQRGIFNKNHFYKRRSMEISGKGLLHFYQQALALIGNQTYHRTNMF